MSQFVKVLRKTTRWASQMRRVDFDGQPEFGQRATITVPRIAELLNGLTLVVTMPDIASAQLIAQTQAEAAGKQLLGPRYGWTNSLGHALIQRVELEIGGTVLETLDGRLLEVLDELYEPLGTLQAKNRMICRAPNGFGPTTWVGTPDSPVTVYVPLPFWFSKPGILSHALPIDALNADLVRVHVTFRPVEQLFYTDARMDERTVGFRLATDVAGAMPAIQGGRFWQANPAAAGMVYTMNASMPLDGVRGELVAGVTMPFRLGMQSAYMLADYVSVEQPEAIALRTAELSYRVEQHVTIPLQQTQGVTEVRVPLPFTNPTKELLWVFQRPEAEIFNAWFLFTRDLGPFVPARLGPVNPCSVPWWPDAVLTPSVSNKWSLLPAFRTADSEPMSNVALFYNSYERFIHEGPSLFRTLLPTVHATKAPLFDRYVYMWPFGYGEGQRVSAVNREGDAYAPRGETNWDKIPRKEMFFTMTTERNCGTRPNMNLYVWTTVWNVFKIYAGRGGMLFTN